MTNVNDKPAAYVKVVDRTGKEYICPLSSLRDPDHFTEEELKYCFDSVEEAFSDKEVLAIIKSALHKD